MAEFEPGLKKRLEELWGEPVNLYRALGNHPPLTAAWTEFANAIRHDSRTPRKLREIMILRTAQIARSLETWRESRHFDDRERAALALTEGVMACEVSDEIYERAAEHFDHAEYVELCLTAAFYAMVSRMLDAMRVEFDPDIREHSPRLP
jgi:alkylhydroperoxidase family enzyme